MKFLLLLVFVLFSNLALASGRIQVQPNFFTDSGKIRPLVGLAVYEKFSFFKGAYNGWYGFGDQAFTDRQDVGWYSIRNAIDFYTTSKLVLSPGVQSVMVDGEDMWQHRIFVRASYELW